MQNDIGLQAAALQRGNKPSVTHEGRLRRDLQIRPFGIGHRMIHRQKSLLRQAPREILKQPTANEPGGAGDCYLKLAHFQKLFGQVSKQARGVACVDSRCGNVLGHHGAGADDDTVAYFYWQDRGIAADADSIANERPAPRGGIVTNRSSRLKQVIDEHDSVSYEAIVTDRHQLADERVRLNTGSPADPDLALDFDEGADETVVADLAPI
jgi:hypothetical protein